MGRILVIGAEGQLGSDVVAENAHREVVGPTHRELDVTDEGAVTRYIEQVRPDAVVNTAAFHHTGQCEEEPGSAYAVNAAGPLYLARACARVDCLLVHISSDYVFDGSKRKPYVESDPVAPLNVYGLSKAAGEMAVASLAPRHYIVRTSGLYGHARCRAKGDNFVTKMLEVGRRDGKATVVTDEILTPTWTRNVARQVASLCEREEVRYGIVHASDEGQCSWFEFAQSIYELSGTVVDLTPARVNDFPSSVRRPAYSVLANQALESAGASVMRNWRESLEEYLRSAPKSS